MVRQRAKRKKKVSPEVHQPPTVCVDCGAMTVGGGLCTSCVKSIQAAVEAEVNPAPAAPPSPAPEPEPPPEKTNVFICAPAGCYRCGVEGHGKVCAGCASTLFGLPLREGDVKLVYPTPCNRTTGW